MERAAKHHRSAGVVLVAALAMLARPAGAEGDRGPHGIAGAYLTTVLIDTGPGSPPRVNLEHSVFGVGGSVMSESNLGLGGANPFLPPPLRVDQLAGYGNFILQGNGRIALTFKRWLYAGPKTPAAIYGNAPIGTQVGVSTVRGTAVLRDGEIVDGKFTFKFRNLAGQVVFGGKGTWSAKRIAIEDLLAH